MQNQNKKKYINGCYLFLSEIRILLAFLRFCVQVFYIINWIFLVEIENYSNMMQNMKGLHKKKLDKNLSQKYI